MDPAAQLARDGPKDEARMAELSFRRVKSLRWQHGLLVLSASWPGASVQEDHERKRRLAACWGVEVEVQMVQGAAHIGVRREEASAGPAQLLRYLLNTHPFTSAGYKDISLRDVRSAVSPFRRAFVSFAISRRKFWSNRGSSGENDRLQGPAQARVPAHSRQKQNRHRRWNARTVRVMRGTNI